MELRFTAEAKKELIQAGDWYESKQSGLALEFLRAVDAAAARIQRAPEAHRSLDGGYRRVLLRHFPFMLVYTVKSDVIVVVSVFHQSRKPKRWHKP